MWWSNTLIAVKIKITMWQYSNTAVERLHVSTLDMWQFKKTQQLAIKLTIFLLKFWKNYHGQNTGLHKIAGGLVTQFEINE